MKSLMKDVWCPHCSTIISGIRLWKYGLKEMDCPACKKQIDLTKLGLTHD